MDPRINADITALRQSELAAGSSTRSPRRTHRPPKFATIFRSVGRRDTDGL